MKIFFSLLFVIAIIATFVLLITSLVFRFKKNPSAKKVLKFTGIAFILSIVSLVGVDMNTTPQEKEALAKQRAEKQKAEEKKETKEKTKEEQQKLKEQKKEEEKKLKQQKEQEEKAKKEEQQKLEEQKKAEEKQKEFVSYAQNIRGGNFIKDMKLNNNEAEIMFYDSYESYKSVKADSNITEAQYKQYFSSGDAIEKMFVSEPARLLRQFPDLNAVTMTLPFDGKTYSTNLDRKSLNEYIGFKIEELKVEDQSWVKKFNTPYVYNKIKRKAFFEKFVIVQ
ncbi:hypothetical protein [Bacillus pseudomycoides]|uniref:hypothetical protein n=1 Tax=Bacillus pseudomycoides TaxID=64104 RepID=UPI002B460A20|nr:hypothetical protein [Bacillus pseudomycoides]MEB3054494.1 hypothetical protein [Bacillus pseudomycoides]